MNVSVQTLEYGIWPGGGLNVWRINVECVLLKNNNWIDQCDEAWVCIKCSIYCWHAWPVVSTFEAWSTQYLHCATWTVKEDHLNILWEIVSVPIQ